MRSDAPIPRRRLVRRLAKLLDDLGPELAQRPGEPLDAWYDRMAEAYEAKHGRRLRWKVSA